MDNNSIKVSRCVKSIFTEAIEHMDNSVSCVNRDQLCAEIGKYLYEKYADNAEYRIKRLKLDDKEKLQQLVDAYIFTLYKKNNKFYSYSKGNDNK